MKLSEVTTYNLKSQQILNESWSTLTESQKLYVGRWEKELWPLLEEYTRLCEAALTADQIQQIFQSAEDTAMASGSNKSALGKAGSAAATVGRGAVAAAKLPVDIAKQVNAKIDELGRLAQKAGPVQNADQKFDQLKKDILAKNSDSKIVQGIQKVSDWAKENPGKASLAVGILTTLAAFAGGPVGGAAAGLIFRATKDLLQGEKLSTAVGKSVKTAAYGAIAGWALEGIGDWLEGIRADAVPYEKVPGLTKINVGAQYSLEVPGFSIKDSIGSMIVPADQADNFIQLVNNARNGDVDAFRELWNFTKSFDIRQAAEDIAMNNQVLKELAIQNDQFLQNLTMANNAIAAIAQGTISGKMDSNDIKVDGEPVKTDSQDTGAEKKESLSMEDRFEQYLNEGPLDALKKAGGAIKSKAAAVGKELGNKVTVAKLMKQWKAMGEPTDAGSIMNILQDAGMSNDQIGQIGQAAKVDLSSAPTTGTSASSQSTATGTAGVSADIKSLADEIKNAGPEVIDAVKAMLSSTPTRTGGKVAGQLSTNPKAVSRRQATAAKRATAAGLTVSKPAPTPAKPKAAPVAKPKYAKPKAAPAPTA